MSPARQPALLRLLRAAPGAGDALRAALAGADFEALSRDAARHGLAGLLRHELQAALVELPPRADRALGLQAMAAAAVAMRVKRLLFLALDALREQGVRPVLLKGYALGARLYPDPLMRSTSDVDLLIAPEELEAARRAMPSLGLSPEAHSDAFYPPAYRHHFAFAGPSGLVELHLRLIANWGAVWDGAAPSSRAVAGSLEGREVRYLRPEDELVYLALHAANHMLSRLGWVYDLKLFARAYPALDWDRVVEVARAARLAGPAFYALDAARRLVGAELPDRAMRALAPSRVRVAAARRLFSGERLLEGYLNEHKRVWAAAKLLLADSPARVAVFAARRVVWNARRRGGG